MTVCGCGVYVVWLGQHQGALRLQAAPLHTEGSMQQSLCPPPHLHSRCWASSRAVWATAVAAPAASLAVAVHMDLCHTACRKVRPQIQALRFPSGL